MPVPPNAIDQSRKGPFVAPHDFLLRKFRSLGADTSVLLARTA